MSYNQSNTPPYASIAFLDFQRIVKEAVTSTSPTCDPEKISEIFLAKFGLPAESDFYDESDEYYEYEQALGSYWPRDLPDRHDVIRRLFNALLALARAYYSDSAKNPRAIAACEFCDSPQVATPRKPSSAKPAANLTSNTEKEKPKPAAYKNIGPSQFELIVKEVVSTTHDPERISEILLAKFGLPAKSKLYEKLDEYETFKDELSYWADELSDVAYSIWSALYDLADEYTFQLFCKEVRTRAQRNMNPDNIVSKVAAILCMGESSRGMDSLRQLLHDVARPSVDDLRPIWAEISADMVNSTASSPASEKQPVVDASSAPEPKKTPPEPEAPMNDTEATNFLGMTEVEF